MKLFEEKPVYIDMNMRRNSSGIFRWEKATLSWQGNPYLRLISLSFLIQARWCVIRVSMDRESLRILW